MSGDAEPVEAAAAPYVGDKPVDDNVKTLFSKQNGLQTVRGIGTALVILHHMTGAMVNAAAVFDAFFVISGYLISIRLIVLAQTARVRDYFVTFYTFRIRRIFPVAILTLAITALVAHLMYVPARAHNATVDVAWAFFFAANHHFAATGTNYFQQGGVISPVLNFWSLSVEEQFYLAWPLVILIALWVARRRGRGTGVTPVALVIIVASFTYGWRLTATHPIGAYYSTLARVWDFGIGALMANVAVGYARNKGGAGTAARSGSVPLMVRLSRHFEQRAALILWVGVVLFVLAMFFTPAVGYPVPAAAFGMVGMGIIFFANTLKRDPSRLFARARPLIWLGDMSYSLYVVHFPIIVFASSYIKGDNALLYSFEVAASLCAAVLMYNFVEKPARQSWGRTREWFRGGGHRPALAQATICGVCAVVLFTVIPRPAAAPLIAEGTTSGSSSNTHQDAPPVPDELTDGASADLVKLAMKRPQSFSDPHLVNPTAELGHAIGQAVSMTKWPSLSNGGRVDSASFAEACNVVAATRPPCVAEPVSGVDPNKVAVGLGDSTMLSYWPMLRDALVPHGWTVVMYGLGSCPAAAVTVRAPTSDPGSCATHHDSYPALLAAWKPSLVFLSDAESSPFSVTGSTSDGRLHGARGRQAYAHGLTSTVTQAQHAGARVVVLSPPPGREPIGSCDVAGSSPRDCVEPVSGLWPALNSIDRQVTADTGATYADLLHFFCQGLACPSVVGDTVVLADYIHLTPEYAHLLAPSFEQYLLSGGMIR